MGEQQMKACQWLQVRSRTISAQETASPGIGASVSHLHMESSRPLFVEPFQAWHYNFWCRGSRLMMNTPLMGEQEFYMPFPLILDFWTLIMFLLRKPRDQLAAEVVTF